MIVEENLVVHLFAPTRGPRATEAYERLRGLWLAAGRVLGVTESVDPELPSFADLPAVLPPRELLAVVQDAAGDRQMILRRAGGLLNLSVALLQPERRTEEAADGPGWAEFTALWEEVAAGRIGSLLGDHRLFVASVRADPELEEDLEPGRLQELRGEIRTALPEREGRAFGWWRPVSAAGGFAIWDTGAATSTAPARELVVVTSATRDKDLGRLVWSDGGTELPVLGRHLLSSSRLRYQARILDAWMAQAGSGPLAGRDLDSADLPAGATPEERVAALDTYVTALETLLPNARQGCGELDEMLRVCVAALDDLRASDAGDEEIIAGSVLAEDGRLGEWLVTQLRYEIDSLTGDIALVQERLRLAVDQRTAERMIVPVAAAREPGSAPRVFVCYAHENERHKQEVLDFVNFLRDPAGIEADIDRYHEDQRRYWPSFVRTKIDEADFVIVVASPSMAWALERPTDSGQYRGVRDELFHLENLMKGHPEVWVPRILPVLLPGASVDDVPPFLGAQGADRFAVPSLTQAGAASLLDRLNGIHRTPAPPVVKRPAAVVRIVADPDSPPDARLTGLLTAAGLTPQPWAPTEKVTGAGTALVVLPSAAASPATAAQVLVSQGAAQVVFEGRVVVVSTGTAPATGDVVRFDGSAAAGGELLRRLAAFGCPVDQGEANLWLRT